MQTPVYNQFAIATNVPRLYEETVPFFELNWPADPNGPGGAGAWVAIEEPLRWADVRRIHRRDPDWHGFTTEFLTEDVELGFDRLSGYALCAAAYEGAGPDAEVRFRTGIRWWVGEALHEITEFEGTLDFSTYTRRPGTVGCTVRRKSLQTLLSARADTAFSLDEAITADSVAFAPEVPQSITLHGQALSQRFEAAISTPVEMALESQQGDADVYLQLPTDSPITAGLDGVSQVPLGLSGTDPRADSRYLFKAAVKTSLRLKVAFLLKMNLDLVPMPFRGRFGKLFIKSYKLSCAVEVRRAGQMLESYPVGTPLTGSSSSRSVAGLTLSVAFERTLELEPGDEVYLLIKLEFTHNANELKRTEAWARLDSYSLAAEAVSQSTSSIARGLTVWQVATGLLRRATGSTALRSDYLAPAGSFVASDGCGSNRLLLPGGRLRGGPATKFPFKISWKSLLESLRAIDGIGMGYEMQASGGGGEVLRVEPLEYFYGGGEIDFFEEVFNYRTEAAADLVYSSVEVGYSKFAEDAGVLGELHASHEYATPSVNSKNRLQRLSDLVASGVALELTRRKPYDEKTPDSTSFDEAVFILETRAAQGRTAGAVFASGSKSAAVSVPPTSGPFLQAGQKVRLENTVSNNGVKTVVSVTATPTGFTVVFSEAITSETAPAVRFYVGDTALEAARSERFRSVQGAADPGSVYNLGLTPKRNLLRLGPLLLLGLAHRKPGEKLRPGSIKFNPALSTTLETGACTYRGLPGVPIREAAPLPLVALGSPLAVPTYDHFEARCTRARYGAIVANLRGLGGTNENYGYIRHTDDNGQQQRGWPWECEFDEVRGIVRFKLLRAFTADQLPDGVDCTDFDATSFGGVEADYPGDWLESCRF